MRLKIAAVQSVPARGSGMGRGERPVQRRAVDPRPRRGEGVVVRRLAAAEGTGRLDQALALHPGGLVGDGQFVAVTVRRGNRGDVDTMTPVGLSCHARLSRAILHGTALGMLSIGSYLRQNRSSSGVTLVPCTTIDSTITASVRLIRSWASAGGKPWLIAYIR